MLFRESDAALAFFFFSFLASLESHHSLAKLLWEQQAQQKPRNRAKRGPKKGQRSVTITILKGKKEKILTKSINIPHLPPPTAHKMHLILRIPRPLGVPLAHQRHILIHALRLDLVKRDAVHILTARQHLGETGFQLGIQLSSFFCAVDEIRQGADFAGRFVGGGFGARELGCFCFGVRRIGIGGRG